jgi:putative transposase
MRHGNPDIFNTDQGSQFTGAAFSGALAEDGITISMDGRAPGATMFLSSGYGVASNTRRSICEPMTASTSRCCRGFRQSRRMRTNRRPIAIMRRS